jgi:hypothetical protein
MKKKLMPVVIPDQNDWLKRFCLELYSKQLTGGLVHYGDTISPPIRQGRFMASIKAHGYGPLQSLEGRELYIVAWFDNIPFGTKREAELRKQSCYERLYEIENFDKLIFEIVDEKSLCMFHY